jgi:hypothetical protein
VHTHIVDRDDIRMLKDGSGGSFRSKALDEFLAGQGSRQDHFHRYDATETLLPGFVDDAHAAARYFAQQIEVAERSQRSLFRR